MQQTQNTARAACPVASTFIQVAKANLSNQKKAEFTALAPVISTKANGPNTMKARLERLTEMAINEWAPKALETVGHANDAEILRNETDTGKAAELGKEFTKSLQEELLPNPFKKELRPKLHAMKTVRFASHTARLVRNPDPAIRMEAAEWAATTLAECCLTTGVSHIEELVQTVKEILSVQERESNNTRFLIEVRDGVFAEDIRNALNRGGVEVINLQDV